MPFAGPAPPTDASERRDGMSESEKLQNMDISALRRVDTGSDEPWHGALTTFPSAALLMICARIAGSLWNITHDCDEVMSGRSFSLGCASNRLLCPCYLTSPVRCFVSQVMWVALLKSCGLGPSLRLSGIHSRLTQVFNFWEPLHFLVYGSGMQTWEYHPAFALRSWLFLLFHLPLTKVLSAVAGSAGGKVVTFYAMRAALAVCGGLCESLLVVATRKAIGEAL